MKEPESYSIWSKRHILPRHSSQAVFTRLLTTAKSDWPSRPLAVAYKVLTGFLTPSLPQQPSKLQGTPALCGPLTDIEELGHPALLVPVSNPLGRTFICRSRQSTVHSTQEARGMALLGEATLPPEAHGEGVRRRAGSTPPQQTGRPLCEEAGQHQASWPAHSCLSGVITSVASRCSSSEAATQVLKYSLLPLMSFSSR